ncbi:hypothetical protein GLYMA_08G125200v4 [Glycine max]|uniref:Uncharacterized protein n=2 Tax=Glycine subgen. Soja TaxID=1462606 RepID=K7L693_SOYBN|nr:hypothetical protein JHK87_021092 [Glycine soja]KAG5015504.1 hypothetical protein JHK85_021640 [Glycine max]KHN48079.1 hypothetical protein glysoja_015549 [Glycine soja]KRH43012.1 hypothetical protein GLYMA_08G125200v4 [Glycine max]RZB96580.1 hypothetical protein D0Y65_020365 [Glycine soja]
MVWNSMVVLRVARASAEAWQCIAEPLNSEQILDLVCCFPLHQLALFLYSFFCTPQSNFYHFPSHSDSDHDDSSDYQSSSD